MKYYLSAKRVRIFRAKYLSEMTGGGSEVVWLAQVFGG
jgi:hypothetical protein